MEEVHGGVVQRSRAVLCRTWNATLFVYLDVKSQMDSDLPPSYSSRQAGRHHAYLLTYNTPLSYKATIADITARSVRCASLNAPFRCVGKESPVDRYSFLINQGL